MEENMKTESMAVLAVTIAFALGPDVDSMVAIFAGTFVAIPLVIMLRRLAPRHH